LHLSVIIDAYRLKKYIYIYQKSYIVRGKDILTFRDSTEYDKMKLLLMVRLKIYLISNIQALTCTYFIRGLGGYDVERPFQLYRGRHFIGGGTGVSGENHRPVASHRHKHYHIMWYRVYLA
jgi:hypothetical protein